MVRIENVNQGQAARSKKIQKGHGTCLPAGRLFHNKRGLAPLVLVGCAMLFALCAMPRVYADDGVSKSLAPLDEGRPSKLITLKMMIVNPSDKYKQTYPMKAYLPEEVQPEHIYDKGDLELGYDPEKKAYYVSQEVELDPGQSVVKAIQIKDIWVIPDPEMKNLATEARDLFKKLKGTALEERGKLLVNNVEVLLTQIFERQNDETVTPEQHISIYRDNREKVRDIQLDLVALRRLVASTSEGLFGKGNAGSLPFGSSWNKEAAEKAKGGGIPAWVAWRIIFGILAFLGLITFGFYWTWQTQVLLTHKRNKKAPGVEAINLDDLFQKSHRLPDESAMPEDEKILPANQHPRDKDAA